MKNIEIDFSKLDKVIEQLRNEESERIQKLVKELESFAERLKQKSTS